jgi:hypothetical protein
VLRRPVESALAAPVAAVHEPAAMDRPSIMQGLLQRIEHEACVRRARGSPAHDPSSVGVDDKGDVDKAGPGRDIGEVGEPKDVWPWRLELAVDVIQRAWRSLVANRGPAGFAADDPCKPMSRISRGTVQRATSKPSRLSCRQTLRTP